MTLKEFFFGWAEGLMNLLRPFIKLFSCQAVTLFTFFFTIIKFSARALNDLFQIATQAPAVYEGVTVAINGQTLSGTGLFLVTINTFFPLDLVLTYFALMVELWIFWNGYRLVKSWIPTLS